MHRSSVGAFCCCVCLALCLGCPAQCHFEANLGVMEVQSPKSPRLDGYEVEAERHIVKLQAVTRGRASRKATLHKLSLEGRSVLRKASRHTLHRREFFKDVHELLGVTKQEYNSSAGLRDAHAYLEKHDVHSLLEGLLARAALERPLDLRDFLVETMQDMREHPEESSTMTEDVFGLGSRSQCGRNRELRLKQACSTFLFICHLYRKTSRRSLTCGTC